MSNRRADMTKISVRKRSLPYAQNSTSGGSEESLEVPLGECGVLSDEVVDGIRILVILMPPVRFALSSSDEESGGSEHEDSESLSEDGTVADEQVAEVQEEEAPSPCGGASSGFPTPCTILTVKSVTEETELESSLSLSSAPLPVNGEGDVLDGVSSQELPSPGPSEDSSSGTGAAAEGETAAGKPKRKNRVRAFFKRTWKAIKKSFTCRCRSNKIAPAE
ncbi:uncharacterized protein [Hoplias malabaricus]|uniref:uncharacterized protein n=1 Tax=Hoplias malabaricus TaxID=27720 RepID=UPI003461C518